MRHLIALHETGSFSRAAEQLHISQPALSRSIQTLEEELGLPLIDRNGKRNEFTAFGEQVLEKARRIAFEADELKRSAMLLRGGLAGIVRVGLGPGPAALLVRPLLKRLVREYPMIHVDLVQGRADALLQQLYNKEVDALIIDSRVPVPTGECTVIQLPDMQVGFLCRQGHPLTQLKQVTIADVLAYPVASSRLSAEIGRVLLERYGPEAQPDGLVRLRSDSLEALIELAQHTDAVFLGIYAAAIDLVASGELVELRLHPLLDVAGRFGIFSLARRTPPPALDILKNMVIEEIAILAKRLAQLHHA